MGDKVIPVRVALRIRPLVTKEISEGSQSFISKVPGQPQIAIKGSVGSDEAYTYDFAFGPEETQSDVFETAVKKIVQKIFQGYNVTILAYGQTGSGKTFTMGTADTSGTVGQTSGIIQRAVMDLFTKMAEKADFSFEIKISFLELYMEKVYDLLSDKRAERDIREDPNTGIKINGLTETSVTTWEETLKCLEEGSLNRRTGATAMNQQSSRSHAVFTLTINQISKESKTTVKSSKFHLVDLAGSERASKTQAVGDRFNEGVNINKGLLSLGNVISALCEGNGRHIPYRDSKLTRLLQDSLGGNSHTLMIACVSPADSNYEETMSTLRYADRARKIKNKPIVNQDPTQVELTQLRALLAQYQSAGAGSGTANSAEFEQMKRQLLLSEDKNLKLMHALQSALEENTNMSEKALLAEAANQQMKQRLEELQAQAEQTLGAMNATFNDTKDLDATKTIKEVLSLKSKIEEIQDVQRKNEIEQNNRDMPIDEEENKENVDINGDEEESSPKRLSVMGTDVALRHAKLSDDLKALNAQLAEKVCMVNRLTQDQPYSVVKAEYEAVVSELEKQVTALQQEKDELTALLAQASSNVNACKISEQRRKRLQELEPQIAEYRKKIQEQANVIKLKQRAEEQLKKYTNDIQGMRAQKVKLVRQMREENEKFRTWRAQKEREVARLKDQDRKRQGQLQKMEVLHAKQQNVLRRKMEDAVAVSKRLKDVLSLHSSTKTAGAKAGANSSENDSRIQKWLMGELDLLKNIKQAEIALDELVKSRLTLSNRKTQLEKKLEESGSDNVAYVNALKNELAVVSSDINLRSEQIVELKQKIASADMDTKAKTRLDYLQTMVEAKVALKVLIDECVNARGEAFQFSSEVQDLKGELDDLQRQHDEAVHELSKHQNDVDCLKQKHRSELHKLGRQYDERMLTLMRQLPPCGLKESSEHKVSEEDLLKRLHIQQQELERCCNLQQELNAALNEIEKLKDAKQLHTPEFVAPPPPKPKARKSKTETKTGESREVDFIFDDEDDPDYDSDDDPEWRNTPMGKRFKKMKEEDMVNLPKKPDFDSGAEEKDKKAASKRMSRSHCACRTGGCRNCICSKDNRSCTKECSCSSTGVCKNTGDVLQPEDNNRMLNETFDLGRKRSQPSSKNNSQNIEEEDAEAVEAMPQKKSRVAALKKTAFFEAHN